MTHVKSAFIQIAIIAAANPLHVDEVLRHVDALQIAFETADQPATADAFVLLSEFIQDGRDGFAEMPTILAIADAAAKAEPDSMDRLIMRGRVCAAFMKQREPKTMFAGAIVASALSSWMSITSGPNDAVLTMVQQTIVEIGEGMRDASFASLRDRGAATSWAAAG